MGEARGFRQIDQDRLAASSLDHVPPPPPCLEVKSNDVGCCIGKSGDR
jgi:hypothetical protein